MSVVKSIPIENLLISLTNPRLEEQPSQRQAMQMLFEDQGAKIVNLAEDIAQQGLNPSDLPIVSNAGKRMFTVLEGNRRITAIKLATNPALLELVSMHRSYLARFKNLQGANFPKDVFCAIVPEADAKHWINLKHTGENQGIGIVRWNGAAAQRFRGSTPSLVVVEMVEKSGLLDETTLKKLPKISITNVERMLSSPKARENLGVDVTKGHLTVVGDEKDTLNKLAEMVYDVANRIVIVSDLDTAEQRVKYSQKVIDRIKGNKGNLETAKGSTDSGSKKEDISRPRRVIKPRRDTLIPPYFKLTIKQTKVNRIFDDLRKLEVETFTNSCAVMFRVFIELSLDDFGQRKAILFKVTVTKKPQICPHCLQPISSVVTAMARDMSLKEKIKEVINYMEVNSVCSRQELQGINALVLNGSHILSIDSLNAYVHNKDYTPAPSDLKANWDSVQSFIEKLWAV